MNEGSIYRVERVNNTNVAVPYANLSFGGAELQSYVYDTEPEEPFRPQLTGDVCGTSLLTYGNLSFLKLRYIFNTARTFTAGSWQHLCVADLSDNLINVQRFEKYLCKKHDSPLYAGSGAFGVTEIIGMPFTASDKFRDKVAVRDTDSVSKTSSTITSMIKRYSIYPYEDITVAQDDSIMIEHIFLNCAGEYSDYYS